MSKIVQQVDNIEGRTVNLRESQWKFLSSHMKKLNKARDGDPWTLQELHRHIVSEYKEQQEKGK